MNSKVWVVVLAGMLFVPAACAPTLITPAAVASPSPVVPTTLLVCPPAAVVPETAPSALSMLSVEPVQVKLTQPSLASNLEIRGGVLVKGMVLEPNIVELGTNVTLSVMLMNTADLPVTYQLVVKIDDTAVLAQDVMLGGRENRTLNLIFAAPVTDGVYKVSIDDFYRELDVWS